MAKLGAALFCLAFVVVFGGVGVGATWAIARTVHDAMQARDWVKVKATVEPGDRYRYTFKGKEYTGTRLGTFALGGSDDIDDWDDRMAAYLQDARDTGKPIMVHVNPGDPAQALVDPELRWELLRFLSPFSLVFGGLGVGALVALVHILRGEGKKKQRAATRTPGVIAAGGNTNVAGMWIFALFWNAISWPVAILAVPEIMQEGNWIGLLVLLFPFVGLIVLWSAIRMSFASLRGGKSALHLATEKPRVGAPLQGRIVFAKAFAPGTLMTVRLVCMRNEDGSDGVTSRPQWQKVQDLGVTEGPEGSQVSFRFDVPAGVAPTSAPSTRSVRYSWRLDVHPAKQVVSVARTFDIEVLPAAVGAPADVNPPAFQSIEKLFSRRPS